MLLNLLFLYRGQLLRILLLWWWVLSHLSFETIAFSLLNSQLLALLHLFKFMIVFELQGAARLSYVFALLLLLLVFLEIFACLRCPGIIWYHIRSLNKILTLYLMITLTQYLILIRHLIEAKTLRILVDGAVILLRSSIKIRKADRVWVLNIPLIIVVYIHWLLIWLLMLSISMLHVILLDHFYNYFIQ